MKRRRPSSARRPRAFGRVLPSLVLLCAPLAFQLASAAQTLPDSMWIMLLLSLWSSLVAGLLFAGVVLKLLLGLLLARLEARPAGNARA